MTKQTKIVVIGSLRVSQRGLKYFVGIDKYHKIRYHVSLSLSLSNMVEIYLASNTASLSSYQRLGKSSKVSCRYAPLVYPFSSYQSKSTVL